MIRTLAMLGFWTLAAPVAALIGFPWTFISGDVSLLYRMFMIGAWNGVRLTGVRVETVGLDKLDPVDRGNREAGIESVKIAKQVVHKGLNMTIYVEGKRSFDGKLLPFKKGPFYLAMECGVPVVPVTITGTHEVMPKGRFAIKAGTATVIFHPPIEPKDFGSRECLMEKVRAAIDSGLPEEKQESRVTAQGALRESAGQTSINEGGSSA